MKEIVTTNDNKKTMSSDEIKDVVYDVRTFYYTKKYDKFCFILNICVALLMAILTNFNCFLFALSFIAFDFLTIFIDRIVTKSALKKSIKKIKSIDDFKRVLDSYDYTWDWNGHRDDVFYFWYKALQKEFNKLEKLEDNKKVDEIPKIVRKDELSILEVIQLFKEEFNKLTKDNDINVFQPCLNACDFIENKLNEGMVLKGPFAKQFVVYMEEFLKNLNTWIGFTKKQKDDHYKDTLLASETLERWVKKEIEAIEKDVAADLRVSVRTLVDMMEEDINDVQTSIDLKEKKERDNKSQKEVLQTLNKKE